MKNAKLMFAVTAAGCFIFAGAARATITGYLWDASNSGLTTDQNVPASPPSTPADVIFSVANGPIAFTSITDTSGNYAYQDGTGYNYSAYYTIGSWLGTGGATITGGTVGSGDYNTSMDNVLVELVGQVTLTQGQTFTVTHDDGLTFEVGGNYLVNTPGPTAPVTTTVTYGGPSGTFDFQLLYAEVGGPGAVLQLNLPLEPVPEATTVIAGLLLFLPLGASTFRILRKTRTA